MPTLNTYLAAHMHEITQRGELRQLQLSAENGVFVEQNGHALVSFAGNDYLGLRQHPAISEAATQALKAYGSGAGASRLITGNHPLYAAFEQQLAMHAGSEAALVMGSGYSVSVGVIPALVGKGDLILADKLVHACMLDGAALSGAKTMRFLHNDMAHLEAQLKAQRAQAKHCLILTEHVFSMDGDIAPLARMVDLAKFYDAWVMVDDAHGLGIVEKPTNLSVDIWMGTLSKSAASYGGYVCGSALLIQMLVNRARSFMFSTGLPPSVVASAHTALQLMAMGEPTAKLWHNIRFFASALGIDTPQSAVIPVIIGAAEKAVEASHKLREAGFLVPAIRPPTVAKGTARLRISLSAAHSEAQLHGLASALKAMALV
jgi:8-amino-7-oxononanoate synthase